jgi:hypothetical protein
VLESGGPAGDAVRIFNEMKADFRYPYAVAFNYPQVADSA